MLENTTVHTGKRSDRFTCSGIVVTAEPPKLHEVCQAIEGLEGLRIHQRDETSGRLIVTQEASSDTEQAEGLLCLQRLPGVLAADLVYYHREEPETMEPAPGQEFGVTK